MKNKKGILELVTIIIILVIILVALGIVYVNFNQNKVVVGSGEKNISIDYPQNNYTIAQNTSDNKITNLTLSVVSSDDSVSIVGRTNSSN